MSPIGTPTPGAFLLTDVSKLPNVTIAYPGERWSDKKASGVLTPGQAVVPSGDGRWKTPVAGGSAVTGVLNQIVVASRTIDVPDTNAGSIYQEALGPNEIRNLPINDGDYVLALYSGGLHLTLVVPDTYVVGDLIGWIPAGVRPTGKSGVGAWGKMSGVNAIGPLFEVEQPYRKVNAQNEGVLTVRSLRGQGPF